MTAGKGLLVLMAMVLGPAAGAAGALAEKCETPQSIRFSMIPLRDLEQDIKRHQPLFRRITELTGHLVQVIRPTSYSSVIEGPLRGSIDIAELGPATYVDATRGDGRVTAFATVEKRQGVYQIKGPYYHAMLVVLVSGRFKDVGDLRSARLALADPAARRARCWLNNRGASCRLAHNGRLIN